MPSDVKGLTALVDTAKEATSGLEGTDLHRVAFERVLDHLLRNGAGESPAASRGKITSAEATEATDQKSDSVFGSQQQRTDAIAGYFDVTPEEVIHLFDTSGETPSLVIHASSLDKANAVATWEIALLVTGGRTALGQKTTTNDIRDVVGSYGRLDRSNFMSTLAKTTDLAVLGKPKSPNRVVRMKVIGAEKARELVQRLIGERPGGTS